MWYLLLLLYVYGAVVLSLVGSEIRGRRKGDSSIPFVEILHMAVIVTVLWPLVVYSAYEDWQDSADD